MSDGEKFVMTVSDGEDEDGNIRSREVKYESEEAHYDSLDPWEEWGAAGRKDEGLLWCAICYALLPPHARLVQLHVRQHPEGRGR